MKSNVKIFQIARQLDITSEKLRLQLNNIVKEERYTSINQFILEDDLRLIKELATKTEDNIELVDDLDKFRFSGVVYDYNVGHYIPVILELTFDEVKKHTIIEGEPTNMLSRVNLRSEKLLKRHINRMVEHPLVSRRNKCKKK